MKPIHIHNLIYIDWPVYVKELSHGVSFPGSIQEIVPTSVPMRGLWHSPVGVEWCELSDSQDADDEDAHLGFRKFGANQEDLEELCSLSHRYPDYHQYKQASSVAHFRNNKPPDHCGYKDHPYA